MTNRINSLDDLKALREKAQSQIDLRQGQKDLRITVHMGTCGIAAGARDILMALIDAVANAGVDSVSVQQSGCAGLCDQEPMISLTDKAGSVYRYGKLDKAKVRIIVNEHVVRGNVVREYLLSL